MSSKPFHTNEAGEATPHTDYTSVLGVRRLFRAFTSVRTDIQNFETYKWFGGKIVVRHERMLQSAGRILVLQAAVFIRLPRRLSALRNDKNVVFTQPRSGDAEVG